MGSMRWASGYYPELLDSVSAGMGNVDRSGGRTYRLRWALPGILGTSTTARSSRIHGLEDMMVTLHEIEMFAGLLSRAGVTQIEAVWANGFLDRLRALAQTAASEKIAPETAATLEPVEEP